MREALKDFAGSIKVGGRIITNLRYADDVVLIAVSMNGLQDLVNKVNLTSNRFGLPLNASKTKIMKISKNENGNDKEQILLISPKA